MREVLATLSAGFALALAGCGGGGGDSAIDLTKRLPADGDSYAAAEIAEIRDELGIDEDADPFDPEGEPDRAFLELATGPFAWLGELTFRNPEIADALEIGQATAAASAFGGGAGGAMTVLATDADTAEIGEALAEAGMSEEGDTFTIEDGPAFRLEDGLIFAAGDGEDIEAIPDEAADEPPVGVLEDLEGLSFSALREPSDCVAAYGTSADADGSGELVIEVDGEPDLARLQVEDSDAIDFGEPEASGSTITVPVSSDEEGIPAADRALQMFLVVYECD